MTPEATTPKSLTLLGPGTVVTSFDRPTVVADGGILWDGGRILSVGPHADLRAGNPDATMVEGGGGLILPGLVNLHHHFYSSLARGLDPGCELTNFGEILDGLWWRLDRALDRDTVRVSAELALSDSIRWGATTVFDHHASPSFVGGSLELIAEAVDSAGLSGVLCYEVSDRNGHHEALAGIRENFTFFEEHRTHPRIRGMLGLHASFTLSDATLEAAAAKRPDGIGCHIHVAEDKLDIGVSKMVYGAAPIQRLEAHGLIDERTLAIHCIHLGSDDRKLLGRHGAVVVHNPESNANNGVGRLDLEGAAEDGCRIGLGTDGMSSAMLAALRAAFLGVRGGRRDPTAGFAVVPQLLATNAAVAGALLDEPQLGRLEPGAPADICVLDTAPPTPVTASNVFANLVYGAAFTPVRHTIARGRVLMEDGRLTTIDARAVADEARRLTPALWERFHALGASRPEWLPTKD